MVQVPAFEGRHVNEEWLRSLRPAIPPETLQALQALQRRGFRVQLRREMLPLGSRDGRRLVTPVDGADVYFVGNPAL